MIGKTLMTIGKTLWSRRIAAAGKEPETHHGSIEFIRKGELVQICVGTVVPPGEEPLVVEVHRDRLLEALKEAGVLGRKPEDQDSFRTLQP